MIIGGVNEGTLPSTAMVRIGDVVNSEADTIHQQLAGGLTVANLLHGSANPIGGQSCVIKLREGAGPEGLKLAGAPGGIKFALGENVKQSNWGDRYRNRFPQTRMGVPAFHTNRFTAAKQYAESLAKQQAGGGPPVRRDLELETIAEIIRGTRLIHCHSYRQDEVVVFLRVMESFGVRVATLQHILEGYKVADEIAKHGAGASAFSDWWAYKLEVYDAIPQAGSIMRETGRAGFLQLRFLGPGPPPESGSRQSSEIWRHPGGGSPEICHRESGQTARHRPVGRFPRARQGWGLCHLERTSAGYPEHLPGDVD